MSPILILWLAQLQTPPFPVYEGARLTWGWEYPTNYPDIEGRVFFRMMTNGTAAFSWPTNGFNLVGTTNTNFVFAGKSPIQLRAGTNIGFYDFTLRAVDLNGIESDDSNLVPVIVDPIRLKIDTGAPFKATFEGNKGATYHVEGLTGFGATWTLLGSANEDPPLSGHFYFVDIEKRDIIFYRIVAP